MAAGRHVPVTGRPGAGRHASLLGSAEEAVKEQRGRKAWGGGNPPTPPERVEQLLALVASGQSISAAGRQIGIHASTATKIMRGIREKQRAEGCTAPATNHWAAMKSHHTW